MAKALLGHVSGPDPGMLSDIRRLRQRVRDLEARIDRTQQEHEVLAAAARLRAPAAAPPQPKAPARGKTPRWPRVPSAVTSSGRR